MIWNGAHVVINSHLEGEELRHNLRQPLVKAGFHFFTRKSVVFPPHHHGYRTTLALSYPAFVIFVEPLGHLCGLTQLAHAFAEDVHQVAPSSALRTSAMNSPTASEPPSIMR
jgi:hypothetical protein